MFSNINFLILCKSSTNICCTIFRLICLLPTFEYYRVSLSGCIC